MVTAKIRTFRRNPSEWRRLANYALAPFATHIVKTGICYAGTIPCRRVLPTRETYLNPYGDHTTEREQLQIGHQLQTIVDRPDALRQSLERLSLRHFISRGLCGTRRRKSVAGTTTKITAAAKIEAAAPH